MALLVRTLQILAGIDFAMREGIFNPDPTGFGNPSNLVPYNFTNFNARLNIRLGQSPTSTLVATLVNPTNLSFVVVPLAPVGPPTPTAPNGIMISIPRALSLGWQTTYPNGFDGYFELYGDNLGSNTTVGIMSGQFILSPGV